MLCSAIIPYCLRGVTVQRGKGRAFIARAFALPLTVLYVSIDATFGGLATMEQTPRDTDIAGVDDLMCKHGVVVLCLQNGRSYLS